MKQNDILNILSETITLMPDIMVRKEFLCNKIKEKGYSLQAGCKAIHYYYTELQNALDGKKSLFNNTGSVMTNDGELCYYENERCLFRMSSQNFISLNSVITELSQYVALLHPSGANPLFPDLPYSDQSPRCAPMEYLELMAPEIRQELMINPVSTWDFDRVMNFFVGLICELHPIRMFRQFTTTKLIQFLQDLGCIRPFIESWLLKAFDTDDTFTYAYNVIAQSESISTGVHFPQKDISVLTLKKKIKEESRSKALSESPHPEAAYPTGYSSMNHPLIKTHSESGFFRIIENLPIPEEESSPSGHERDQQLFPLFEELREEIIENITILSGADRNFYLKRLVKRANNIPESAMIKNPQDSVYLPYGARFSLGNKSLLIDPEEMISHFDLVIRFKYELLEFLSDQLDIEETANEILPFINPLKMSQNASWEKLPAPGLETMNNHFDSIPIQRVYTFFKKELVQKKYLTDNQLLTYIDYAFHRMEQPANKFWFLKTKPKSAIIRIFYRYFAEIANKPYTKQKNYAALLGDYFEGFDTLNVSSNFSR